MRANLRDLRHLTGFAADRHIRHRMVRGIQRPRIQRDRSYPKDPFMTRSRFARRTLPALFLTVFLTACGGSNNQPAVDSKQLQQRLDQFVATVTAPDPTGEFTVTAAGPAKVTTGSDGAITGALPTLTFKSKDGVSTVLQPVTLRFANGGSGLVNVEATIPSSLQIKDKDGKVNADMKIGSQTLKAVWVEKLQTLDKVDMRLGNISITSATETGSGKIDLIALTGGMTPKGGGLYDGKYDFVMKNFAVEEPKEKSGFKMSELKVLTTMAGAKMEDWAKAAKEAGYTLSNPDLFKTWTGGELDAKMIAFMKRMPEFLGTLDYTYSVAGLEMTTEGKPSFGLKNAWMGAGAGPDAEGLTKVKFAFGLGGMSGSDDEPMLPPEAEVQDAVMDIEASGVPGRKLWELYMDALPLIQAEAKKAAADTAAGDKDAAANAASSAAMDQLTGQLTGRAIEMLSAAKLAIVLNKLNVLTPTAKMTGKGSASYLPIVNTAPEGKVVLRFTGLDALSKAMEKRGPKDEMAQDIAGALSAIRAMGKPDPASPEGDRAYLIEILLTKDGRVLANGQDLLGPMMK
jgi:hypothetical protein